MITREKEHGNKKETKLFYAKNSCLLTFFQKNFLTVAWNSSFVSEKVHQ